MNDQDRPDRPDPTDRDLAVATLVGRYIERRQMLQAPRVHDLLAMAAEFGDSAVRELRDVLAFYEAMRASESAVT
jgi:hypothetical protein